jgi:isopentenyl diphosphate isomerase/L-lactate dehydrogenase-like FMN-dependent dehydrogenase
VTSQALALGAKAVCIGRPYVWGLADINPSFVIDRGRW